MCRRFSAAADRLSPQETTQKDEWFFYAMYYVYVLYSAVHQKTYVGYTSDLTRRIEEHNSTGERGWTISYRPWEILYTEEFENKAEAIRRQRYFKTGVGY